MASEKGLRYEIDNEKAVDDADVVIVAVPLEKIPTVIDEVLPHMKASSLFLDIASLRMEAVTSMLKYAPKKGQGTLKLHA